jgi:hypothetical protein
VPGGEPPPPESQTQQLCKTHQSFPDPGFRWPAQQLLYSKDVFRSSTGPSRSLGHHSSCCYLRKSQASLTQYALVQDQPHLEQNGKPQSRGLFEKKGRRQGILLKSRVGKAQGLICVADTRNPMPSEVSIRTLCLYMRTRTFVDPAGRGRTGRTCTPLSLAIFESACLIAPSPKMWRSSKHV